MLSVKQVGERLGELKGRKAFSAAGVTNYIHRGYLKAQKIGNMWLIEEAELQRFCAEEFTTMNFTGGRPRSRPLQTEQRAHGNAGKKYRQRGQADAS